MVYEFPIRITQSYVMESAIKSELNFGRNGKMLLLLSDCLCMYWTWAAWGCWISCTLYDCSLFRLSTDHNGLKLVRLHASLQYLNHTWLCLIIRPKLHYDMEQCSIQSDSLWEHPCLPMLAFIALSSFLCILDLSPWLLPHAQTVFLECSGNKHICMFLIVWPDGELNFSLDYRSVHPPITL